VLNQWSIPCTAYFQAVLQVSVYHSTPWCRDVRRNWSPRIQRRGIPQAHLLPLMRYGFRTVPLLFFWLIQGLGTELKVAPRTPVENACPANEKSIPSPMTLAARMFYPPGQYNPELTPDPVLCQDYGNEFRHPLRNSRLRMGQKGVGPVCRPIKPMLRGVSKALHPAT
jgi:hypothetical protein